MAGTIVEPRGSSGSGWCRAFSPDGSGATVTEMTEGSAEREASLPRGAAIQALEVRSNRASWGTGRPGGTGGGALLVYEACLLLFCGGACI